MTLMKKDIFQRETIAATSYDSAVKHECGFVCRMRRVGKLMCHEREIFRNTEIHAHRQIYLSHFHIHTHTHTHTHTLCHVQLCQQVHIHLVVLQGRRYTVTGCVACLCVNVCFGGDRYNDCN